MSREPRRIVIRRVQASGGHGHHGGAWKVAYADFVTAMMAFFLVMWLVNQPQDVKNAVAGYFKDPGIFEYEGGKSPIASGAGLVGAGNGAQATDVESATAALERAAERIKEQIKSIPGFKNLQDQVEVKVTAEGLRIELQEGGEDTFFDSGSARVKGETQQVLRVIAKELAALPQAIAVEGHTDAAPFGRDRAYTNWELSADRANAARRIMESAGLPSTHVKAVRGFADTILRTPDEPFNPRNRRVSIVVQNAPVATAASRSSAAAPAAHAAAPSSVTKVAEHADKADAHATPPAPAHDAPAQAAH
jgi:chemotaxis protein MotB